MKTLVLTMAMLSLPAMGQSPKPTIEHASAYGGYATINGGLETPATDPVGVTVKIGGLRYSTVSGPDGKWGLVIRHVSTNYSVESFSLTDNKERSGLQEYVVK